MINFKVHWVFPLSFPFHYWTHPVTLKCSFLYILVLEVSLDSLQLIFFANTIYLSKMFYWSIFIIHTSKSFQDNSNIRVSLGLVPINCLFLWEHGNWDFLHYHTLRDLEYILGILNIMFLSLWLLFKSYGKSYYFCFCFNLFVFIFKWNLFILNRRIIALRIVLISAIHHMNQPIYMSPPSWASLPYFCFNKQLTLLGSGYKFQLVLHELWF